MTHGGFLGKAPEVGFLLLLALSRTTKKPHPNQSILFTQYKLYNKYKNYKPETRENFQGSGFDIC